MIRYILIIVFVVMSANTAQAVTQLWQTHSHDSTINIYDLDSMQLIRTLHVGGNPHGITAPRDTAILYVTLENNGQSFSELLYIDSQNISILKRVRICPGAENLSITPDGAWLYIPCDGGKWLVVNARTGRAVRTIETGGQPHNTVASKDGETMYLAPLGIPKGVTIVGVRGGHEVTGFIPFGGQVRPLAVSADNRFLFQHVDNTWGFKVAHIQRRAVTRVVEHSYGGGWLWDVKNLANRASWKIANRALFDVPYCHGLALRPDQTEVWSVCGDQLTVHAIQNEKYPEVASITLKDRAYWIVFSPDSAYGAIALANSNEVVIFDTASKKPLGVLATGKSPKRNLIIQ